MAIRFIATFCLYLLCSGSILTAAPKTFSLSDTIKQAEIAILVDEKLADLSISEAFDIKDQQFSSLDQISWVFLLKQFLRGTWARFYLENKSLDTKTYNVYQIFPGQAFDLYYKHPDGFSGRGKALEFSFFNPSAFELNLPPGKTMVMVRTKTMYHFHDKFFFSSKDFTAGYYKDSLVSILLFGGLLIGLFSYNIFIFLKIRTNFYAYYLCYIASTGILVLPFFEGLFATFSQNEGFTGKYLSFFAIGLDLIGIFSILFAASLLNIKVFSPRLYRFALVTVATAFLPLLLKETYPYLLPYYHFLPESLWLLCNICFIYTGFKHQYRPTYFFTLAWLPVIFAGVFVVFPMLQDVSIYNQFSLPALMIAGSIELILFSFAVADRAFFDKEQAAKNERDLETTNTIQNALLPSKEQVDLNTELVKPFSLFSYYRSTEFSGGDWYGVQYHDKSQKLYIQICDISGHGVASSIVTGVIAGSVLSLNKRQIEEQLDSQHFLNLQAETIGDVITQTVARVSKSATMGFAAIDFRYMKVSILLAGHPPVVLIRNGKAKFIQNRNALFGFRDIIKYKTQTFDIKPKDRLIFYTDGLIEHPTKGNLSFRYMKNYFERGEFNEETIENDLLRLDKFEKKGLVDDACVVVVDIKDPYQGCEHPSLKKNA